MTLWFMGLTESWNTMRNKILTLLAAISISFAVNAQSSSVNTFSPYTMYGLGDISLPGTAYNHSMGGIGVAMRDPLVFNIMNPASYSSMNQRSALFNFGLEGQNYTLKSGDAKTGYNGFNLHDFGLAFPLYKKIGFGFSLAPVANVGYRTMITETNPDITSDLGDVTYSYVGSGGISQMMVGLGIEVVKGLSLGANFLYYFGSLDRDYNVNTFSVLNTGNYRSVESTSQLEISRIMYSVGVQYALQLGEDKHLNLGATYLPKTRINATNKRSIETIGSNLVDTVAYSKDRFAFDMPSNISGGVYYSTRKFGIGFDYVYQDWGSSLKADPTNDVRYKSQQDFKLGAQFTPNRYDVRSVMKRWTYKIGVRYRQSYVVKNNHDINEMAASLGVGIPFKATSRSSANIGVEYGFRGTEKNGLAKESFVKIFVSMSLFGDDLWFVRPKFD